MRAVILAGGLGSRLKPFTIVVPKPLVPVGEMPILELLIRQLEAQGFSRITLAVGYLSSLIEAYCGRGERWGVAIDYVREQEPLGTAGFLGLLEDFEEDRLLVVNGDILTDLDMGAVTRGHDPHDAATICSHTRRVTIEYGVLETDGAGRLNGYTEKPELHYEVSMGVNVLSRWAVEEFVVPGERTDMPDLMRTIAAAGRPVRVHRTGATWFDMGSMDELERAVEAFAAEPHRFRP